MNHQDSIKLVFLLTTTFYFTFMEKMTPSQKSVLTVATLTSFLGPFLISSVNVALPAIEKEFQISAIELSWIIMAFLLSSAIFLLPTGKWADIKGAKTVFKQGTVLFTLFTLLSAVAPGSSILIAVRFLQGIGAAMLMTTGPAILINEFPIKQRGRVLGITVAAVYLGLSVGPFAGGFITHYLGWRSIFWISGIIGILVMIVAFSFLGHDRFKMTETPMDHLGAFLYSLALAGLVIGSSQLKTAYGLWIFIGGTLFMILFLVHQYKSTITIFPLRLFKSNRLFAFSNAAALINYSATFAIIFLLSLFLQKIQHYSPSEAGSILVAQPIVMAALSPLAGRLSDRFEPRWLATIGMTICAIGLFGFSFLTEDTSVIQIIGILAFIGLGFALFSSPNMNTIMSSVDKSKSGIASGMAATMRVLGQMVSMSTATLLFALFFGNQSIEEVADQIFTKGIRVAFLIFAIICIAGIYFSMNRGKMHHTTPPSN